MRKMRKVQLKKIRNQLKRYLYRDCRVHLKQYTQLIVSSKHLIDENGNFVENPKLKNIGYANKRITYIDLVLDEMLSKFETRY